MPDFDVREFYQRYIDALNAHDFTGMDEFVHDEIMLHSQPGTRDALVAQLDSIVDAVPDFHWETTDIAISGEWLAVRLVNTGTPVKEFIGVAPTGKPFEITEYAIYTVRDGKFLHMSALHDAEEMQKQLTR